MERYKWEEGKAGRMAGKVTRVREELLMKVGWRRRIARGGEESLKTGGCRAWRERRTGDPAG
jgi:hypothetical protein